VKERRAKNKRNTHHSTKAAHQVADVDGIIEATKKKRANKKQRYQESKYLREHGAELLRGGSLRTTRFEVLRKRKAKGRETL